MASGRFVTFCYARIDIAARRLTYANAGHNPPLLIRQDGSVERLSPGGTVLGVFPENAYEQGEYSLIPGDRLVFYTDGISEGRNSAGDELTDDGVAEAARRYRALDADAMLASMLVDIERFNGGKYEDDATLIVAAM
jgi:sigma-B regulation protein RsbU (phosphoserine phosphatase)